MVGTPKNSEARCSAADSTTRGGVERREEHRRRPGEKGAVDPDAKPVRVVDGKRVDQPVVGFPPPGDADRLDASPQVPLAQDRALRRAGGARRETDERRMVRAGLVERDGSVVGQLQLDSDDPGWRRCQPSQAGAESGVPEDRERRLDLLDDVGELALGAPRD